MTNGYKILWTDNALKELQNSVGFLKAYWTEKELRKFATDLDKTLNLISQNPYLFQESAIKKEIRRAVVLKINTLYYRINANNVEILSFFSNRQNPKKRKLK
jgi:plasmid stabilization system protein ParE